MPATVRIILAFALLSCEPPPEPPPSLTGTYLLQICRTSCARSAGGEILEEGRLILLDRPLTGLSQRMQTFLALGDGDPTLCWIGNAPEASSGHAAPHSSVGASIWHQDTVSGQLRFNLWQTVDSRYEVTVELQRDSLVGRARLYAVNDGGPQPPDQIIRGKRVGAPDPTPCAPAAEAQLAHYRAIADTVSLLPPG